MLIDGGRNVITDETAEVCSSPAICPLDSDRIQGGGGELLRLRKEMDPEPSAQVDVYRCRCTRFYFPGIPTSAFHYGELS